MRDTAAVPSRRRRKRILKDASGYWGNRKNKIKVAYGALMKAMAFSSAHRRKKKNDFRRVWTVRLNAAARIEGISYSRLIHGLKLAKCELDRRMLSELAIHDPRAFSKVVTEAKQALSLAAS